MKEKAYLSVIIPAYNEEKYIKDTLVKVNDFFKKQNYHYEIIVIDDGSCDNTYAILKKLELITKNLIILKNNRNYGKGYSISKGMLFASGEVRLFMDADNSTNIDQIARFLPFFKNGYDIVIGDRRLKDSEIKKHQSFYRKMLGNLGNILIRIIVIPGIKDTQCGFKIFSAKSTENIFSKLTVSYWGFDVEALAIANKLGYKIKTVPVIWSDMEGSKIKPMDYILTIVDLFKIKINFLRKKYDNSKQER